MVAVLFTTSAVFADEAAGTGLAIGDVMPMANHSCKNVNGSMVTFKDIAGARGTVVVFWSNQCPFVKQYQDRFIDIVKTYSSRGFGFVAVNPNDPDKFASETFAKLQTRAKEKNYPFPYVVDHGSQLARAFGASRTPEVYLFNANGILVYKGAIDDATDAANVETQYLREALNLLLTGASIGNRETTPIGCSIKWYDSAK